MPTYFKLHNLSDGFTIRCQPTSGNLFRTQSLLNKKGSLVNDGDKLIHPAGEVCRYKCCASEDISVVPSTSFLFLSATCPRLLITSHPQRYISLYLQTHPSHLCPFCLLHDTCVASVNASVLVPSTRFSLLGPLETSTHSKSTNPHHGNSS
jgi:hypothetical protein